MQFLPVIIIIAIINIKHILLTGQDFMLTMEDSHNISRSHRRSETQIWLSLSPIWVTGTGQRET